MSNQLIADEQNKANFMEKLQERFNPETSLFKVISNAWYYLNVGEIHSMKEFELVEHAVTEAKKTANDQLINVTDILDNKNLPDEVVLEHECLRDSLTEFLIYARTAWLTICTRFADYLLHLQAFEKQKFDDVLFSGAEDEEDANKLFRKISLRFHPDRVREPEFKERCQRLFPHINNAHTRAVDRLISNYQYDADVLQLLRRDAEDLKDKALDQNALEQMKRRGVNADTKKFRDRIERRYAGTDRSVQSLLCEGDADSFQHRKNHYFQESLKTYRKAMKMLDGCNEETFGSIEAKMIQQINLREEIALTYHYARRCIEPQLYLVGAMFLAIQLSDGGQAATLMKRMVSTISKIQQRGGIDENDSFSAPNVVANLNRKVRPAQAMRDALSEDTSKWIIRNLVRPDGGLVRASADMEEIAIARHNAIVAKTTGGALVTAGAGVLMAAGYSAYLGISAELTISAAAAVAVSGPAAPIVAAAITSIAVVCCGIFLIRRGFRQAIEPEIREKLNSIVHRVLEHYRKGEYKFCFKVASEKYHANQQLIEYDGATRLVVDPKLVTDKLLRHGFRPDGIAYLLIVFSEVLLSGQVKVRNKIDDDMLSMARNVSIFVADGTTLVDAAAELDDKAHYATTERLHVIERSFRRMYYELFSDIPVEFLRDAAEAPFKARVEEMRNIARINLALTYALKMFNAEAQRLAKEYIAEARNSIEKQFQYFTLAHERWEALQHLFAVLNIAEEPEPCTGSVSAALLKGPKGPDNSRMVRHNGHDFELKNLPTKVVGSQSLLAVMKELQGDNSDYCRNYNSEDVTHLNSVMGSGVDRYIADIESEMMFKYENEDADDLTDLIREAKCFKQNKLINNLLVNDLEKENLDLLSMAFSVCFIEVLFDHDDQRFIISPENRPSRTMIRKLPPVLFYREKDGAISHLFMAKALKVGDGWSRNSLDHCRLLIHEALAHSHPYSSDCLNTWEKAAGYAKSFLTNSSLVLKYTIPTIQTSWSLHASIWGFLPNKVLSSHTFSELEIEACFKYAECCIMIADTSCAVGFLVAIGGNEKIKNHAEYWRLMALAARKHQMYFDSLYAHNRYHNLLSSSGLSPSKSAYVEHRLTRKLNESPAKAPVNDYVQKRYEKIIYLYENQTNDRRVEEKEHYDILSIDGGGVRGVIPAVWLAEIEKVTRKPISMMVDELAGTSTGSLVAAGLTVPHPTASDKPKFSAADILQLYTNRRTVSNIFSQQRPVGLFTSRYSPVGRTQVIYEYLDSTRMKNAITNLLIVSQERRCTSYCPHLFTKAKAKANTWDNVKIADAVLASTAAQTFFPAHVINHIEYVDGGLVANNPSECAYHDVKKRGVGKKIRVWSMGTGDDVQNRSSAQRGDGILHYGAKVPDISIGSQMALVDENMINNLGGDYHRWQVRFDKKRALDDYSEGMMVQNVESARQFIEETEVLRTFARAVIPDFA